jgi:hypothetical protein
MHLPYCSRSDQEQLPMRRAGVDILSSEQAIVSPRLFFRGKQLRCCWQCHVCGRQVHACNAVSNDEQTQITTLTSTDIDVHRHQDSRLCFRFRPKRIRGHARCCQSLISSPAYAARGEVHANSLPCSSLSIPVHTLSSRWLDKG